MKKIVISHQSSVIVIAIVVVAIAAPLLVLAHRGGSPTAPSLPYWGSGGLVSCGGSIKCDPSQLTHTFIHIIYFGITIALYVIAPIAFGWGGIMFLISGGNESKIGSAKKIMTGTAIGVVLVLLSFLIVKVFISVLGIGEIEGFGGGGGGGDGI